MKRIALLLAAVGLASGCVVETCDPREVRITWDLIDVDGFATTCTGTSLSDPVDSMDVWLDGYYVDTLFCDDYGITLSDVVGTHDVILEGFSGSHLVVRDMWTFSADDCGATQVNMYPGETWLGFLPESCTPGLGTTYLEYQLSDVNYASPVVIDTVYGPDGVTCAGGIFAPTPVPYGYYRVDWVEEVSYDGAYHYTDRGSCDDPTRAFFYGEPLSGRYTIDMYDPTFGAYCR